MWLEFIDRPIDEHLSIYYSLTYTTSHTLKEQSRSKPSLLRIFGEHLITSPITTLNFVAAGAATYTLSKTIVLNHSNGYLTTPSVVSNKVHSPTTIQGYTATVNVKATKKLSPVT